MLCPDFYEIRHDVFYPNDPKSCVEFMASHFLPMPLKDISFPLTLGKDIRCPACGHAAPRSLGVVKSACYPVIKKQLSAQLFLPLT